MKTSNKVYLFSKLLAGFLLLSALALTIFLVVDQASSMKASDPEPSELSPADMAYEVMNLHLDLPTGSRIDYLRIYFYDTSASNSTAWVTTYNGGSGYTDLTSASSSGTAGYGTTLSAYVGHIVNNLDNAYVLNWRPVVAGKTMMLCGLRVAYRLPLPGDTWSNFYYINAAGSSLKPRNSGQDWQTSSSGGCVYTPTTLFIPLVTR